MDDAVQEGQNAEEKAKKAITDVRNLHREGFFGKKKQNNVLGIEQQI